MPYMIQLTENMTLNADNITIMYPARYGNDGGVFIELVKGRPLYICQKPETLDSPEEGQEPAVLQAKAEAQAKALYQQLLAHEGDGIVFPQDQGVRVVLMTEGTALTLV